MEGERSIYEKKLEAALRLTDIEITSSCMCRLEISKTGCCDRPSKE